MIFLENEKLKVAIKKLGAELKKITFCGEERLYDGSSDYWSGSAPVLFPICGRVRDNTYILDGKEYTISPHGFAKNMLFTIESCDKESAVFLLKSNEETLKSYPFEFEFRVKYTLNDNSIKVEYEARNLSDKNMFAALGSHEAYLCKNGVEDFDVIFEKEETLNTHLIDGPLVSEETETVLYKDTVLPLYEKYFKIDALIFTDIKSRYVTLKNRKTGKSIGVSFPDCDYLLIWSKVGAPFVCIEPWSCCPGLVNDSKNIFEKPGIKTVLPSDSFKTTHTISFYN